MDWEATVRKLMLADTSDLVELARLAGRDPKTFYVDANFRGARVTAAERAALGLPDAAAAKSAADLDHSGNTLEEQIVVQRAVLEGYSRDQSPQSWAWAQMGLGLLLHRLGRQDRSTRPIHAAVDAYEAALEVLSRDSGPADWAEAQARLADAHADIGRLSGVRNALRQAIKSYSLALSVHTKPKDPFRWAEIRSRLGLTLAEFHTPSDIPMLEEAVDILRDVRDFWIEKTDQENVNIADYQLGLARLNIGRAGHHLELQKARATFERVLANDSSVSRSALWWALGETHLALGEIGDRSALNRSLDALMQASELQWQEGAPEDWAQTRALTGKAYRILGNFGSALDAVDDALTVLTPERTPREYAAAIQLQKECRSAGRRSD